MGMVQFCAILVEALWYQMADIGDTGQLGSSDLNQLDYQLRSTPLIIDHQWRFSALCYLL